MPPISTFTQNNKLQGKKLIVYHTNWSRKNLKDLQCDKIDDVCYAFFNLSEKGNVSPPYGFSPVKIKSNMILCLGGWSGSKNFSDAVLPENRLNFVNSLIKILYKYPGYFSGINLDWEYCTNDGVNYGNDGNISRVSDGDNFIEFCKLLKESVDTDINIGVACPSDPDIINKLDYSRLNLWVDEFHVMTYDFMGFSGQKVTGPHTNLKKTEYCMYSIEETVDTYFSYSILPEKIFIGVALYTRGFGNTDGPGLPGKGGSPNGIVKYKDLPVKGSTEHWDPRSFSAYSYDPVKRIYNSYDNINSVYEKCKYIWEKNLGGVIAWESSCDSEDPEKSLICSMNTYLKTDPRKSESPNNHDTFTAIRNWKAGVLFILHEIVNYNLKKYKCIVSHTSNAGWKPDIATTLWSVVDEKESENEIVELNISKQEPTQEPKERVIKGIKITGDIDMKDIEIIYE